jgi:hypothetical protein
MMMTFRLFFGMIAFSLSLFAMPAMALPTINITNAQYTASSFGGIHIGSPAYHDGGLAGQFLFSGADVSNGNPFNKTTYCIEVTRGVFSYVTYEVVPIASIFSSTLTQTRLAGLLVNTDPLLRAAQTAALRDEIAASIALAVWEIIYETDTALTVDSGNFWVYGDFNPFKPRVDSYLANVANNSWTADASRISGFVSDSSQNQIFLNAPVPEPATWLMMLLGFGFVGAALRRRNGLTARGMA